MKKAQRRFCASWSLCLSVVLAAFLLLTGPEPPPELETPAADLETLPQIVETVEVRYEERALPRRNRRRPARSRNLTRHKTGARAARTPPPVTLLAEE